MPEYYRLFADTKQQYRELFRQVRADLMARLTSGRQAFSCLQCAADISEKVPDKSMAWLSRTHEGCGYRPWQALALRWLEQEVGREIWESLQGVSAARDAIGCHMCGMCCRMASSEHSYEELQARAQAGDAFAGQFTGIFIPYESTEAARRKFPGVVDAVLAESGQDVHFYHCPYIGEDNRCTIYGTPKRPAICGSYPETPLAFVYEQCAWRSWKDDHHPDAMRAHAMLAICEDWTARLRVALGA